MRNGFKTTITLRRIDICDLLIATTTMQELSDSKKWEELHNLLERQLNELDESLDMIEQ